MNNFKPTFLYIKQHLVTGKLYLGKTTRDPEKYLGSGKHWVSHINKHGRQHVTNLWYCLFLDSATIKEFAKNLSTQYNIVSSSEWLNLLDENGLDGGSLPGRIRSEESKKKQSMSSKGHKKRCVEKYKKPKSLTHRLNISLCQLGKKKVETHTDEVKKRLSLNSKGRKWWNNTFNEVLSWEQPEGYERGRLTR